MHPQHNLALVTGASRGIGRGIALGLAAAGWDVVINHYQDEANAAEAAAEVRSRQRQSWIIEADVGDGARVQAMFAQVQQTVGRLALLVNNAGVQTWASLLTLREEDWDRTIRTNLKGCFLCMQQAARLMTADGEGGAIVNIGSGANHVPFPNLIDYCASKGGIQTITKVAAVELGPHKIRVNCVAPGAVENERTRQESPDYAQTWSRVTPLRQIGEVTHVADAVVFLASPAARHITAQTLYVDGGLCCQIPWPYATDGNK
jgi:NAD(P)-dependent dehydrogenase (short-subunit alcohol dehydrogenase family)